MYKFHEKLELYRAHTPRAHCAIYRSAFVVAWLYQGLIDPISPGCIIAIGLLVISAKTSLNLSLHQI